MQTSFEMSIPNRRLVVPNILSSYRECSCMPKDWGRKRWNGLYAKGASRHSLGLTLRWMSLLLSSWDLKPQEGEIMELYNDVYQLKRLLGSPPCGLEQAEELAQEIVTSLIERAPVAKVGSCHAGKRTRMGPLQNLHPQLSSQGPPEKNDKGMMTSVALTKAREAHWWALVATNLLEERIKRLSWLATRV